MLTGSTWALTHGSASASLEFDDDSFWGTDGCNRVRGRYRSGETGGRIAGPVMSTRMACHGDAGDLAAMVGPLLVGGTALVIDGDELVLVAGASEVRFGRPSAPG